MLFLSCFFLRFHALMMPCGHLLGKGSNCEVVTFPLVHGSGVVLDCIDS